MTRGSGQYRGPGKDCGRSTSSFMAGGRWPARRLPAPGIPGNPLTDGADRDTIQASREPVEKLTSTRATGGRPRPREHRVRHEAPDASLAPPGLLRLQHGWCVSAARRRLTWRPEQRIKRKSVGLFPRQDKDKIFRQQTATQVARTLSIGGIGRTRQKETRSGAQSRRQTADGELAR